MILKFSFLLLGLTGLLAQTSGNSFSRMERNFGDALDKWARNCKRLNPISAFGPEFERCIQVNGISPDRVDFGGFMDASYRSRMAPSTVEATCQASNVIGKCLKEYADTLKSCLPEEIRKELKGIIDEVLNTLCGQKGIYKKFISTPNISTCYDEHLPSILDCLLEKTELFERWIINIDTKSKTLYSKEYCLLHKELKQCILPPLKKCPQKAASEVFEDLLHSLKPEKKACNSAGNIHFNVFNVIILALIALIVGNVNSK